MTSIETIEKTITKCQGITDKIGQAWPHSNAHARALSLMIILDGLHKATEGAQVNMWQGELENHLKQSDITKLRESIHQTHHALAELYTAAWGCIARRQTVRLKEKCQEALDRIIAGDATRAIIGEYDVECGAEYILNADANEIVYRQWSAFPPQTSSRVSETATKLYRDAKGLS